MYAAISGLDTNQTMLNATANDLANVNTVGYKAVSVTFANSLTQVLRGASGVTPTNGGTNPEQIGLGAQVQATVNEMTEGAFQSTNNPLDVAIEGPGFLRVGPGAPVEGKPTENIPANVQYTRAGDLTTNTAGYLTTQGGEYVIGRDAVVATTSETGDTYEPGTEDTYIQIPPGSSNVSIGQDGSVSYTDETKGSEHYLQRVTAGYLSLATFANETGLERLGGSQWARTANSGAPLVNTPDTPGFGTTVGGELRAVERRSRDRDDEHDHRRARLPGELARDLHRGRNARHARDDAVTAFRVAACGAAAITISYERTALSRDNSEEPGVGRPKKPSHLVAKLLPKGVRAHDHAQQARTYRRAFPAQPGHDRDGRIDARHGHHARDRSKGRGGRDTGRGRR